MNFDLHYNGMNLRKKHVKCLVAKSHGYKRVSNCKIQMGKVKTCVLK